MATKSKTKYCSCCGTEQNISQFYVDYTKKTDYLPICKNCIKEIGNKAEEATGKPQVAIWATALKQNVPCYKDIVEEVISKNKVYKSNELNWFALYYQTVKEHGILFGDIWESTLGITDIIKKTEDNENRDYKALAKIWGRFNQEGTQKLDTEVYDFLEDSFAQYTANIPNLTRAAISQYQNLCKAQWQKIKADESGDISAIDKAQKHLSSLLKDLGLDDFNTRKSEMDKHLERLIWKIEETEPAEEEDREKYKDMHGFEKGFDGIMRSMKNLIFNLRDFPDVPEEEE